MSQDDNSEEPRSEVKGSEDRELEEAQRSGQRQRRRSHRCGTISGARPVRSYKGMILKEA